MTVQIEDFELDLLCKITYGIDNEPYFRLQYFSIDELEAYAEDEGWFEGGHYVYPGPDGEPVEVSGNKIGIEDLLISDDRDNFLCEFLIDYFKNDGDDNNN